MAVMQKLDEAAYAELVLGNPNETWELIDGELREKPGVSWDHGVLISKTSFVLQQQLDDSRYVVWINHARVRIASGTFYVPDVAVIPVEMGASFRDRHVLAVFDRPLPLVVEVWSPSTGDYDVETKLPDYQRRGDLEIWRLHPYERTLTASVRQPNGEYAETLYRGGVVASAALPGVVVDLATLFKG